MSVFENVLECFLRSYSIYYNVIREGAAEPFDAEADFRSTQEQYFLIKSAKISETAAHEFVYFASCPVLTQELLERFESAAWEKGLEKVSPAYGLQRADVLLYIITGEIPEGMDRKIKHTRHSKSFGFSFWGTSHFKLVVLEYPSCRLVMNRLGREQKKLVSNILKSHNLKGEKK